MGQPARLRVVDEHGELHDLGECATCREWQRKYQGVLLQLAQLRADKEAEAQAHQLWPQALKLFEWWRWRTNRDGRSRWTADRFWIVEPFLRREGYRDCWDALRGLTSSAYHMKLGRYADREGAKYDEFERPFKDQRTFERFREMIPRPDPKTVALFDWYDEWKRGLDGVLRGRLPA